MNGRMWTKALPPAGNAECAPALEQCCSHRRSAALERSRTRRPVGGARATVCHRSVSSAIAQHAAPCSQNWSTARRGRIGRVFAGAARGALSLAILVGVAGCEGMRGLGDRGEVWAIKCISTQGADQLATANYYAESLRLVDALNPELVQTTSDADLTHVFYGRYVQTTNPFTRQQVYRPAPDDDLALIKSLSADGVTRPFGAAHLLPLPSSDRSVGNPEWDAESLAGYWSLQVAVFYNTDTMQQRRQAAVDYCSELRKQGHEAYFYHGPSMSSVLLGAFPPNAMRAVQQEKRDLYGQTQRTSVNVIANARLRALQNEFPHNLENLHIVNDIQLNPETGQEDRLPRPSIVVKLPKAARAEERAGGTGF